MYTQCSRVIATISAPGPLSSVAILKDGSTLVAGSVDGKSFLSYIVLVGAVP